MRHPILSRVPLVFLGTCFRWAVTVFLGTCFRWAVTLLFAILSISFVRNQIPQNVKVNSLGCVTSGMYSG